MSTGELVLQTGESESRERLREAFNTPLYPVFLIVNEVMQETFDLHRHCRRIIVHKICHGTRRISGNGSGASIA
ncbi:hypothetical protein [Sorangium sp. So ce1335]|uniref:hypothetical protein n=1 Tax=Sorangium sp. So ce1335 TaxID=3133335 RepID=UPI003F621898